MKLLVLDSSGLVASVALIEDDQLIAEYTTGNKLTHSQTLLPMLDEVIKRTSFEIEDIDAVAVAKGPGSFTGLRIGAATATEGLVGVDYVPVTLLSTQTVAGTNYRILCEATTVYPGAERHYAVVNVYESLEGNANIISVTDGYVS